MIGWYVYDTTHCLCSIATTGGAAAAAFAAAATTIDVARAGVPRLQCVPCWQVRSLLLLLQLLCGVNVHNGIDQIRS
jgi:hypothetical protein